MTFSGVNFHIFVAGNQKFSCQIWILRQNNYGEVNLGI